MLVLPKSPHRGGRAATGLRETLLYALSHTFPPALSECYRVARLIGRNTDKPWFNRINSAMASAARSARTVGPLLTMRAMRAVGTLLTGGVALVRVGEIATLGVVMLGLSASAVGTASPAGAVAPLKAVSFTPTGCIPGPAVARMVTTDEIASPMRQGLRMNSTGAVYICTQPGLTTPAPVGGAPRLAGQVILVELSQEWLYAYQDGRLVLASPVSSGRADLRTPTGTFTIQQKLADSMFTSPWPVGSPYYYAPLHVNYGLLFLAGGFYIHDAPWRTTYGPGSEEPHVVANGTTETGSHGCVEMPTSTAAQLYAWAQLGATVIIRP